MEVGKGPRPAASMTVEAVGNRTGAAQELAQGALNAERLLEAGAQALNAERLLEAEAPQKPTQAADLSLGLRFSTPLPPSHPPPLPVDC